MISPDQTATPDLVTQGTPDRGARDLPALRAFLRANAPVPPARPLPVPVRLIRRLTGAPEPLHAVPPARLAAAS